MFSDYSKYVICVFIFIYFVLIMYRILNMIIINFEINVLYVLLRLIWSYGYLMLGKKFRIWISFCNKRKYGLRVSDVLILEVVFFVNLLIYSEGNIVNI